MREGENVKNFSANLLISAYTLAPLLTTKVMAKDYKPYGSCDPINEDCKLLEPEFDLFHPINSLIYYIIYVFLSIIDVMTDVGTDIFSKNTTNIPGVGEITSGWKYEGIGTFIDFFGDLAIFMLALGIFIAIAEMAVSYANGQGNMAGSFVNIIKATVFALLYTSVMTYIFTEVIKFGGVIMNEGGLGTPNSNSIGNAVTQWVGLADGVTIAGAGVTAGIVAGGTSALLTIGLPVLIAVLAFFLVSAFKFGLVLAKRCVVFMALLAEGSLLPFSMARGYAGNFQSFLQKSMTFMISCMLQVWFFCLGFYFMGMAPSHENWWGIFVVGWAFIECADKVFSYMGTVGGEGSNPIAGGFRGAMGAARTFTHLCAHNDMHNINKSGNPNEGGAGKTMASNTGDSQ